MALSFFQVGLFELVLPLLLQDVDHRLFCGDYVPLTQFQYRTFVQRLNHIPTIRFNIRVIFSHLLIAIISFHELENELGQLISRNNAIAVVVNLAEEFLKQFLRVIKALLKLRHIFLNKVLDFLNRHNAIVVDVISVPDLVDYHLDALFVIIYCQ